jgi:hypothetical protein
MFNPGAIGGIIVKPVGKEYGVFANVPIHRMNTVEWCAWLPVNQRTHILLTKNNSPLVNHIFENPDGIKKEMEVVHKIMELDLQKRLDQGLITTQQLNDLLIEYMNPAKMLESNTHAILLGNGSIYRRSDRPNISWEYDSEMKLFRFFAVENISPGQELTYFTK